ncbi:MAG: hypothetical protein H0T46_21320 [Deltaproteobacteria bacterium]|nr:hypothetical protein [Deltaproteobacteria bacterium]
MSRPAILAVVLAACARTPHHTPQSVAPAAVDQLTLYRDRTLVKQRVELDIPTADKATVTVRVPIGVDVEDVVIVDRGGLIVSELRATTANGKAIEPRIEVETEATSEDEEPAAEEEDLETPPPAPTTPTEITFVASGPKAGRYALYLGYVTDRIQWDAAYTMTTTPARSRVTLRGAIAIRNTTGIAFPKARTYVIDTELGAWRGRLAEQFGALLSGTAMSGGSLAEPRALGTLALGTGETRVELLPDDPARPMKSVLVYDPIGTKLDHGGSAPIRDAALGVVPPAGSRVTESFEVARAQATSAGLPGGPVRLLERRSDGMLAVLGETRLFDAATRIAGVDTVAIGTADGVTGKRARRELTIDDDGKRLVEEFVLTLTNKRATPVEVVLREHLYRGQNWTLAYRSALEAEKEGPQQISIRTTVPANGETKILYVVVYTWEPATK